MALGMALGKALGDGAWDGTWEGAWDIGCLGGGCCSTCRALCMVVSVSGTFCKWHIVIVCIFGNFDIT